MHTASPAPASAFHFALHLQHKVTRQMMWGCGCGVVVVLGLLVRLQLTHWPGQTGCVFLERGLLLAVVLSLVGRMIALRHVTRAAIKHYTRLSNVALLRQDQFHALPCPVWIYDLETMIPCDINAAALDLFGCSRDAFLARQVDALWPQTSDNRTHLEDTLCCLRSSDGAWRLYDEIMTRDGLRAMEIRVCNINSPQQRVQIVVAIDRSSEQRAKRHHAHAVHELEQTQRIARVGAWELDPITMTGRFSAQAYHILGYSSHDTDGQQRLEQMITPADPATQARIEQVITDLSSGDHMHLDLLMPIIGRNAQQRMIHLRAESMTVAGGKHMIQGTLQDVTERERSRDLLREREEQFRELVRVFPDGVLILADECVMYANPACVAQFGFEGEALLGEPLQALVREHDLTVVRALLGATGPSEARAYAMRRRDGTTFYAGLSVGEACYGGRQCRLLVVRDLSEPERIRDALAVSNAELQAMAKRLFSLQEDERRAISRDLHDDIGQAITAMKLSAHAARDETDPARQREDLDQIVQLADATITKLRNLSMLLRPPQLEALGLEAAIRWQAAMLFRASPVRLTFDILPLSQRPSHDIELACFRIAQESLTNALRHANASHVRLHLHPDQAAHFRLAICDDGDGFDQDGPRGLGLIMMRERAQTVGGSLVVQSAPGAGTQVHAQLPYHTQLCQHHLHTDGCGA